MMRNLKHEEKINEMKELTKLNEEEISKLNYKEKQAYYRAKNKFGNIRFISKDNRGQGITYRNKKAVI